MLNFGLRFLLEVCLIMCMSSLIALSKRSQENVIPLYNEPHNPASSHAIADLTAATALLVLLALLTLGFLGQLGYKTLFRAAGSGGRRASASEVFF